MVEDHSPPQSPVLVESEVQLHSGLQDQVGKSTLGWDGGMSGEQIIESLRLPFIVQTSNRSVILRHVIHPRFTLPLPFVRVDQCLDV